MPPPMTQTRVEFFSSFLMEFAYIKTDCGVTDRKLSAFFLRISNGQPLDCGLDDFGWGWKLMNLTRFVSLVGLLGMMTSSCIPGGSGEREFQSIARELGVDMANQRAQLHAPSPQFAE